MNQPQLFHTPNQPRHFTTQKDAWIKNLPTWLQTHIQTQPTRLSEQAQLHPCHKCGTLTLTALDAGHDHCTTTTTDLTLLTTDLEIGALLTGRTTHTITPDRYGITITHRSKWNHQARTANQSIHPIAPNHQCGQALGYPIPWEILYPGIQKEEQNNEPPF